MRSFGMIKKRYRAMVYEIVEDSSGMITMTPITTVKNLTVPQVAETMQVSNQTIYREVEVGNLHARRIGACVRIALEDFASWSDACRIREYERGCGVRTLADVARKLKG